MKEIPYIRLKIEGMKHQILAHLGVIGSELGEALNDEIENAVTSYPWEREVTAIVHTELTKAIEDFFRYGIGRQVIKDAIHVGFDTILPNKKEDEETK